MTLADPAPLERTLTVASVPSSHVYVRHLSSPEGHPVRRLPDPDPSGGSRSAVQPASPPVMLSPEWAATADFDLFHLHCGFDASSPEELAELTRTLRRRGKPFVFTVHDLRPHHPDRTLHDRQLDVLVPAADRLITLTPGAAAEILRRWGRVAEVVPHPHVVELHAMAALQPEKVDRHRTFRVGLHVESLRADMDPLRLLPTLVETVARLDGAVLQVNVPCDVLEAGGAGYDADVAAYLAHEQVRGRLELHVHDHLSDGELWSYLASLDACVLPHRSGTHSGWLEACRDLQTTVVAPSCGYFSEQGPVLGYLHDEERFDPDSLRAAVTTAYAERPQLGADVEERRRQRALIEEAHHRIYRALVT